MTTQQEGIWLYDSLKKAFKAQCSKIAKKCLNFQKKNRFCSNLMQIGPIHVMLKNETFLRVFKQYDPFKAKEVLHRLINDPPAGVTLNSDPYANSTEFKHVGWPVRAAAAVVTIFMGFCHCHSKQAHLWHAISSAAAFYGDRKLHLLVQNAIVWNKTLGVVRETNCDLEQISLFPTRNTLVCLVVHSNEVAFLPPPSSKPNDFGIFDLTLW